MLLVEAMSNAAHWLTRFQLPPGKQGLSGLKINGKDRCYHSKHLTQAVSEKLSVSTAQKQLSH